MSRSLQFIIASLLLLVAGCGAGGDVCGSSCDFDIPTPTPSTIELADIIGVWDGSVDHGAEGNDEFYVVVKSNGELTSYDYRGDSYNMGDNCYNLNTIQLTDTGIENTFTYIIDGDTTSLAFVAEFSGEDLILTGQLDQYFYPSHDDSAITSVQYSPSSLFESDFTPECVQQ